MSRRRPGRGKLSIAGALVAVLVYALSSYFGVRVDGAALTELATGGFGEAQTSAPPPAGRTSPRTQAAASGSDAIARAFAEKRSGFMTTIAGSVTKVLPDDDEGSRHQRFIVGLDGGRTVLVAHNIDLARRVPLGRGDRVEVHGQYEWNARGGVLHWTHDDPEGRHEEGWILHEGATYH